MRRAALLGASRRARTRRRRCNALTPRGASVGDVRRYFKPAWFGLRGTRAVKTVRPRAGVKIVRDRWGVPHVEGRTNGDVAFGSGWATAEDRGLLLQLLRGPGRLAAIDAPNIDPVAMIAMRYTNRPTFQQVMSFRGHRPRR